MNEFKLSELIEKLEQTFLTIIHLRPEERLVAPNVAHLTQLKDNFNAIFEGSSCTDVIYTHNTDKPYFGLKINPLISADDAINILITDTPVTIKRYQVEIDSKLFDINLSAGELAAFTIHEISSVLDPGAISEVRALIDLHIIADDTIIQIRNSINYAQLIIFAIKDTLYKVTSALFKDDVDSLLANKFMVDNKELADSLVSAEEKIVSSLYGSGDSMRTPKTIILQWMFMVYKDISHNSRIIKDTLKDSKEFTASILDKQEIDKTIMCVDRIDSQTVIESTLESFIEKKGFTKLLSEGSLFKSLKQNGLRSIENEYYEYAMRAKAAESEEEAMFVIRGINNRIGILEDYVYNTPDISEAEKNRWIALINQYRDLRAMMVKKKIINKKQYGLWFDYSQLDNMDEE